MAVAAPKEIPKALVLLTELKKLMMDMFAEWCTRKKSKKKRVVSRQSERRRVAGGRQTLGCRVVPWLVPFRRMKAAQYQIIHFQLHYLLGMCRVMHMMCHMISKLTSIAGI